MFRDEGREAVIYDLDGTLVSLDVDWSRVRKEISEVMGREIPSDIVWGVLDLADKEGVGDEVRNIISSHEVRGAKTSTKLPTADLLSNEERKVGICSLNCEEACLIALKTHGLTDFVDVVIGRDTVSTRKPDPLPLLEVVDRLGVACDKVIFVGDSVLDEEAARRSGISFRYV